MIVIMKRKLDYIFLWIILLPLTMLGFNFTANSTDESCAGNGTITFSTTNTDPDGVIIYIIYKLPDITTPFATVNTNFINGLSAGTYNVVAQETVNGVITTQQQQVVINTSIVPFEYTVTILNQACSTNSSIIVDVTSGIGVFYEIIDGPMLFPSQTSNVFSGLVEGIYRVRVFNNCGIGVVQTFTVNLNATGLDIDEPVLSNTSPPSCTTVTVTNNLESFIGTAIGYPLNITYEVFPPDGSASLFFYSTITGGDPTSQDVSITIPDFINETFIYSISVEDACGNTYTDSFLVDNSIQIASNIIALPCNRNYFSLIVNNFTPTYLLNFTSFPAGFDPSTFNAAYPGPYTAASVQFGSSTQLTPIGFYVVEIIDSCGRVTTRPFTITLNVPDPEVVVANNGCLTNSGNFSISMTNFEIVTAVITSAPSSYPNALPDNVSAFINDSGDLIMNPVPIGDYVVELIDNCGNVLPPEVFTIPVYVDQGNVAQFRPGCSFGFTSLELASKNSKLISVVMTAAPPAFTIPLPYNVTGNILANGKLYLDNLPAGGYSFTVIDECGYNNEFIIIAPGYQITTNDSFLQINCGSFNVPLTFASNATMSQSFWLQELIDPVTNTWGHPGTNVVYPEGTVPNATNSFLLINNTTNFNLSFNGTFRIFRHFLSFNNGASILNGTNATIDKSCFEVLNPALDFDQALEILSTNRLFCSSSGTLDVVVQAVGEGPLEYSIITKDGLPFFIDNGTSNVFYNLPTGVYTFKVEDVCGNIVTKIYDLAALFSLVTMTQPNDILQCKDVIVGNETFDITTQTPVILGSLSPLEYTVTYYNTITDAQTDVNSITNLTNFNPTTNPQTIFARMIFNSLPNCYEVRSFDLIVGQNPSLLMQPNFLGCSLDPVTVNAASGNLPTTTYLWSTGETTPSVIVTQVGVTNLTVTATNEYGPGLFCSSTKDIIVTISEEPEIDRLETVDWTENNNSITVFTTNNGAFEYSLDDDIYQSSNVFSNLEPGLYTVYVRDENGCGKTQQFIWILYYVRFFTPNGDGVNETWRVKNAQFEEELTVIVFDRYGKVITSFDSNSIGWDGFYNGQQAISDDYWFVVNRQDGRTHRGHFTLKR